MVHVAELARGGLRLAGPDRDAASDAELLCYSIESIVADVALSLTLYEQASAKLSEQEAAQDRDRDEKLGRLRELANEGPGDDWGSKLWEQHRAIFERPSREELRARWAAGRLPDDYLRRLPVLYAEVFVLSLARLKRMLDQLAQLEIGDEVRRGIEAASSRLAEGVPGVKAIRDSVEHAEDRLLRKDRQGRPIEPAPVMNSAIHSPGGGTLIAGSLRNNHFGWTAEDGTFVEVELSAATLSVVGDSVQQAFDALPWREDVEVQHSPRA